jgi:hypothetical protein
MASKNTVTLTFAGETSPSLKRSMDDIGTGSRKMADSADEAAGRIDRVGESADNAEGRFTGLASGIDGVTTLMDDPSPQEFAQGIADIADGIANAAVPAVKGMVGWLKVSAVEHAKSAAAAVAAGARTVASWVLMGAQAMLAAAKMALAWLIGLGPIGLVIAAVGLVIGVLAFLGVGLDDVARIAGIVWTFIQNAAMGVFNWLKSNWPLVLAILTGPFGLAVLAIVRNWDTIKSAVGNALGFIGQKATEAKDWVVARFNDIVSFVSGLPGRIASAASGAFDGLKNAFRAALNWIIGKWNGLEFTLPSASLFGKTVGGGTISTPNLPTFHTGGTFRSPPGMREGLALLSDGETISRGAKAGGSGRPIVINVAGSIRSDRDLINVVEDAISAGRLRTA